MQIIALDRWLPHAKKAAGAAEIAISTASGFAVFGSGALPAHGLCDDGCLRGWVLEMRPASVETFAILWVVQVLVGLVYRLKAAGVTLDIFGMQVGMQLTRKLEVG